MRSSTLSKVLFNVSSAAYDVLTGHDVWYEQASELVQLLPEPDDVHSILDLGCGPGASAFALARVLRSSNVDGVDIAPRMIARARRHHAESFAHLSNLRFHEGDATDLPWPNESFDVVVGHSFLYLVGDRDHVLRQARRVLKPNGTLLLLEPARESSLRDAISQRFGRDLSSHSTANIARFGASMVAWRVVSGNLGCMTADEIAQHLADAGFDRVEVIETLGGLGMHCIARNPPGNFA